MCLQSWPTFGGLASGQESTCMELRGSVVLFSFQEAWWSVFLQLPVSVSSGNKQGYAWLALHEVAAKRGPRRGILQLAHSYRWGSENCNLHFQPPPLLTRSSISRYRSKLRRTGTTIMDRWQTRPFGACHNASAPRTRELFSTQHF